MSTTIYVAIRAVAYIDVYVYHMQKGESNTRSHRQKKYSEYVHVLTFTDLFIEV